MFVTVAALAAMETPKELKREIHVYVHAYINNGLQSEKYS
jgi:AmiR/NasT family two-component response regulator